jgi:hypothetical protein
MSKWPNNQWILFPFNEVIIKSNIPWINSSMNVMNMWSRYCNLPITFGPDPNTIINSVPRVTSDDPYGYATTMWKINRYKLANISISNDLSPSNVTILYYIMQHELGHVIGAMHEAYNMTYELPFPDFRVTDPDPYSCMESGVIRVLSSLDKIGISEIYPPVIAHIGDWSAGSTPIKLWFADSYVVFCGLTIITGVKFNTWGSGLITVVGDCDNPLMGVSIEPVTLYWSLDSRLLSFGLNMFNSLITYPPSQNWFSHGYYYQNGGVIGVEVQTRYGQLNSLSFLLRTTNEPMFNMPQNDPGLCFEGRCTGINDPYPP